MELPLSAWAVLLPYCVGVSALGTLVGLGGGAFVVPLLVLGYGVPLKTAVAAITFSLFPSAALSTIFNIRRQQIEYFVAVCLEPTTVLGAILGTFLTKHLPVRPLEYLFSGFLVFMGTRMMRPMVQGKESLATRLNRIPPIIHRESAGQQLALGLPAIGFFGLVAGTLAGLFGIGGGIVKTPVMIRLFKIIPKRATATSMFMIMFTSATASYSHWQLGTMDWGLALPLGGAFFCGSLMANSFGTKLKSRSLEVLLGVMLIAAACALAVHAFAL